MINFDARVNLNIASLQRRSEEAKQRAQMILDQQVLKDSNFFIPKDTGNLESSSIRASQLGKGRIKWDTKYAKKLYYGTGYRFSKDSNPNASHLWFEQGKSQYLQQWLEKVKRSYRNDYNGRG